MQSKTAKCGISQTSLALRRLPHCSRQLVSRNAHHPNTMVRSRLTRSLTARFTAVGITCDSALCQRLSSENFLRLIADQSGETPLPNPVSQLGQAAFEPFARA